MTVEVVGLCVLPALARSEPGYVDDVLAVASGGHAAGDIGLMQSLSLAMGITYLGGGLRSAAIEDVSAGRWAGSARRSRQDRESSGGQAWRQDGSVFVVRATKKLRDRLGPVTLQPGEGSTTRLGDWYASAWFWKSQIALFVSEATLFPVLMPLAPAATTLKRFPDHLAQALVAQDVPPTFIAEELAQMPAARLAPTANRSVLGIMNEFTFMAESTRSDSMDFDPTNLTALAGWLAGTPCSPLFKRHTSPDRELRALVKQTCQRP